MVARRILASGALAAGRAAAGVVARPASRALEVRLDRKPPSLVAVANAPTTSDPLPIRLVDAGGVGIAPDTAAWGGDCGAA